MAVTKQEVAQLYVATFNRAPEANGLNFWVNSGMTIEDIASTFFLMAETQLKYPEGTTDEEFVIAIYQNVFGRDPEQDGLDFWVGEGGLGGGIPRSEMILTVIGGAQGTDAEVLANKTEVGLYYADEVGDKHVDGYKFSLADITDDDATVDSAKALIDALTEEPPEPGETYWLTGGRDILAGTDKDDVFKAYLDVNLMGNDVNSLNSADRLDGDAGRDQLWANLIQGSSNVLTMPRPIEPTTENIEELYFNARETINESQFVTIAEWIAGGFGENLPAIQLNEVTVAAGDMLDVDYIESYKSDANLVVYGLTTNKSNGGQTDLADMTVSMDHTSGNTGYTQSLVSPELLADWYYGGKYDIEDYYHNYYINGQLRASSMKVLFEQNYLVPTTTIDGGQLYLELMDMDAALAGRDPLEDHPVIGLNFTIGGVAKSLVFGSDFNTYQELRDAVQAAIDAAAVSDPAFALLSAELGPLFTATDTDNDPGGSIQGRTVVITNSGSEPLAATGLIYAENPDINPNKDFHTQVDTLPPETQIDPLQINIELEKVGRGSDGGGMVVGGDNYTKGFDVFNVTVKGNEYKPSSLAYLLTTPHDGLSDLNITSETRTDESYADLQIGNTNTPVYSILNVNNIDATTFMGNLDINMAFVVEAGNYDYQFGRGNDGLELLLVDFDNLSDTGVSFDIGMGAGDDTVEIYLDTDALDTIGDYLDIETGSGDDAVYIYSDDSVLPNSASQRTMFLLDNMDIATAGGEDYVFIEGRARFNIHAGDDSDFVEIDSAVGSSWGQWNFGNNTGIQTFVDRVLYKAQLTVMFAGFESTVQVTTTAADNFVATQLDINDAIARAILANPELMRLLGFDKNDGLQHVDVMALVNGNNELAVSLYQPELVAADPAAGQTTVSQNDALAMAQGLIQTTALTSDDFETGNAFDIADLRDQFNNFTGSLYNDGTVGTAGTAGLGTLGRGIYEFDSPTPLGANSDPALENLNHSEINMGDGANDLLVLDSAALSANTIIVDQTFGKVSIVNFFTGGYTYNADGVSNEGGVGSNTADVGMHALDFTHFLNNRLEISDNIPGNTWSEVPLDVTLNTDATAEANSVTFLNYDETLADSIKFSALTAAQLVAALNGTAAVGVVTGDLDNADLSAVAQADLVGTTQHHIVLVQNELNLGEFKVFHLTSTLDGDGNIIDATDSPDGGDFTTGTLLGTLDFGYGFDVANLDVEDPTSPADFMTSDFTEINLIGTEETNTATQMWLGII